MTSSIPAVDQSQFPPVHVVDQVDGLDKIFDRHEQVNHADQQIGAHIVQIDECDAMFQLQQFFVKIAVKQEMHVRSPVDETKCDRGGNVIFAHEMLPGDEEIRSKVDDNQKNVK